jgi:hypothetical protein
MSGFAALGLSLSLVAQPPDDLFPGRWVPVQIGIVRYVEQPEGAWEKPKLEITLEWQPQDPDRLRWLSVEECREASERAARDFPPMMDTFILAGDHVYYPRMETTSFRYGGPAEVRMLFDLPEGLPETMDLFVRLRGPDIHLTNRTFSASAPLTANAEGRWQTGPVTWTLHRVDLGVACPGPRDKVREPELGPGYAASTTWFAIANAPDQSTKVTLIGAMDEGMSLKKVCFESASLRSEGQGWPPLRITWAAKSEYALVAGPDGVPRRKWVDDPEARPYLMVWFPVPRLPDGCALTVKGVLMPDAVDTDTSLEHVFTGLPNPLAP